MTEEHPDKKKHSEWLIMVYLAGDNNLSAYSIAFLQELSNARWDGEECDSQARVVAAFDSPTPWPKGARYIEFNRHKSEKHPYRDDVKWPLHNDLITQNHIVVSPDFCNSGVTTTSTPVYPEEPIAEEALARFLKWVQEHYTGDKVMLILYGHGPLVAGNTFLSDTSPPSYLKLGTFAEILRTFKLKIDILACDNCVMNGIESAVQLHGLVTYMIGSQGLMLVNGWPVRKIIDTVRRHYNYEPGLMAKQILRVSVLNLLDFTLMERSSEQAICDVRRFDKDDEIVSAVRGLSDKLQTGLQFRMKTSGPALRYPIVADLVRLARLEAQSYWSETFVDLYDFAALLLKKCREFLKNITGNSLVPVRSGPDDVITVVGDIASCCQQITDIFRKKSIVPLAYYVGPQLQYSHGVSIYFPWTLPEGPITFEPIPLWDAAPKDYSLKTPFEEYKTYLFATPEYGDWAAFLEAFFRATLRNVRIVEYAREDAPGDSPDDVGKERQTAVIDLQKSSSSTGDDDQVTQIKNYPRRFYLSPADCKRRTSVFRLKDNLEPTKSQVTDEPGKVSYLGWNIRGLVAEVLGLPEGPKKPMSS